jgi:choice-of-anchor A domain-containing protein
LYVGGTGSISGGGVVNGSGSPSRFSYYGLPSSTRLTYSGAADFVGTINAPQANVQLSGGSSIYGAVICNTFNCSGGSGVHYDQGLSGGGIFLVTSWKEM